MLDDRGTPGRDESDGRDARGGPGGAVAVDAPAAAADTPAPDEAPADEAHAPVECEGALPGHAVTLGDGREWTVPVLRTLDGESTLPRGRELSPEGKWREGAMVPEHADLAARVEEFWDSWLGLVVESEGGELTVRDADTLAADVLAVNYPADEVERLGALDEEHIRNILLAAVDWETAAKIMGDDKGDGGQECSR